MIDFSKMKNKQQVVKLVEPIELFRLFRGKNLLNDLWSGQSETLCEWHKYRNKEDVLIQLNTGAGKTIIGLLIAQSLLNEGIENVVYVCSTTDLVKQTEKEAKDRLNIDVTTRVKRGFSNVLFQQNKAFCITTYAALFNVHSAIRRKNFPGAIIFDDAHVAENLLRNAFTLRIESKKHGKLFDEIKELFHPKFQTLNLDEAFKETLTQEHSNIMLVPPDMLCDCEAQLKKIFIKHKVKNDKNYKYIFGHLQDNIKACSAIFGGGIFELAPPFLPSLSLDIFNKNIRRIYLSATLQTVTDFVRAFGREPCKSIIPKNDAGNGERAILYGQDIEGDFSEEYIKGLAKNKKIIIAVPNYSIAESWKSIAVPADGKDFSNKLEIFKKGSNGVFLLVSRVDGIDLPNETCRIMLINDLPKGASLLERYQWEKLHVKHLKEERIANRITQLFGRIIRGRNDHGIFLLKGKDLNNWLKTDSHKKLLSPLLKKQLEFGEEVQTDLEIKNSDAANDFIDKVFKRDETWVETYRNNISSSDLENSVNLKSDDFVLSEAEYARAIWDKEYKKAAESIEATIKNTCDNDNELGGWHYLWMGLAWSLEDEEEKAVKAYEEAKKRIPELKGIATYSRTSPFQNHENHRLSKYFEQKEVKNAFQKLKDFPEDFSANQAEEAVRVLGEVLLFTSSRPDKENSKGPDVLWLDDSKKIALGFELKTNKGKSNNNQNPIQYNKEDIGQLYNHLGWMEENYKSCKRYIILIGPKGKILNTASPSEKMFFYSTEDLKDLYSGVRAMLEDWEKMNPERLKKEVNQTIKDGKYSMNTIKEKFIPLLEKVNTGSKDKN